MKPQKILIASVLKPADDIRMAWKIGKSIAKIKNTEVHIAGFTPRQTKIEGLTLHPLFAFERLSIRRIWANAKVFKLALRLRPAVFIISTHELLPAAFLAKLICRSQIIYDVRENYYNNILFTDAFPKPVRKPLAALVRGIEVLSSHFIDYFLLAEKAYYNELPFVRKKAAMVENKYMTDQPGLVAKVIPIRLTNKPKLRLLYSGTIAITYGILEAIRLADFLHNIDHRYELTIIGFAPQAEVLAQVKEAIKNKEYIKLIGGDAHVPHYQIVDAIRQSDLGLLPYQANKSTETCIPTKLYEYAANHLPMLVQNNPVWKELIEQWNAGLMIDFTEQEADSLHAALMSTDFYTKGNPSDIYWQEEEQKLLKVIEYQLTISQPK